RQQSKFLGQVVGHGMAPFSWVVGYASPPDTEHDFWAQLKGICTKASAIFPEQRPPGTAGVAGSGASVRWELSHGGPCCFAHVAPRRDVRASVGWLLAPNEQRPPDREASCTEEPRSRLGAVTPGRTCPARFCGSGTGLAWS